MSQTKPIRRHPRHPISLRVRVRMESWDNAEQFISRDISRGGIFLSMPDAAPPGTVLQMSIQLPDGSSVDVRGQVQHALSRERARAEGRRAGIGVRFLDLDDERKEMIGRVIETARALARGSEMSPAPAPRPDAGEDPLLSAVRAYLGELKELDYFEALEIPRDATAEEVEHGFRAQLERWDPGQFAGKPQELREIVAEIVIILQRAQAALSDPAYRAELAQRTKSRGESLDRLFESVAEGSAAEAPLDFAPEAEAPAARLPKPIVESRKAIRAGDYEEASRILSKALAMAPGDRVLLQEYHMTMGRAELQQNAVDKAGRHFDEVIRINPQNAQAIEALRRLSEQPRQEKRALLRRLFHRGES